MDPSEIIPPVLPNMDPSETTSNPRYLVKLKKEVTMKTHIGKFSSDHPDGHIVTRTWNPKFLNAYAGSFSDAVVDELKQHSDVEYVVEDSEKTPCMIATQNTAPWGLARINQRGALSEKDASKTTYNYTYDMNSENGRGVDVYILDSGISVAHSDFGGRARWGITFVGTDGQDVLGHGTHVAGTAGGTRWGVAKEANLIAVKVLGDHHHDGRTSYSIDGLHWVLEQALASGRPSVVNMSYSGKTNRLENEAVGVVADAGIHIVVSAGNKGEDAKGYSPASAPKANTVGACNINDKIWHKSNFGSVVDFFAPGEDVISCATGHENLNWGLKGYTSKSGTSMAAPHVTGIIATILSMNGNMSAEAMKATLKALSVKDKLRGIPTGTANAFARGCIHTPAHFRLESNWAKVATVSPCRATFSEIDNAGVDAYNHISSTIQMLQCGQEHVRTYFKRAIDFMIVSADLHIDIAIRHGTDKVKWGDKLGLAVANFAGKTYQNIQTTDNDHNEEVYKNCPTEQV